MNRDKKCHNCGCIYTDPCIAANGGEDRPFVRGSDLAAQVPSYNTVVEVDRKANTIDIYHVRNESPTYCTCRRSCPYSKSDPYWIGRADRVDSTLEALDWMAHIAEKRWTGFPYHTFARALHEALEESAGKPAKKARKRRVTA